MAGLHAFEYPESAPLSSTRPLDDADHLAALGLVELPWNTLMAVLMFFCLCVSFSRLSNGADVDIFTLIPSALLYLLPQLLSHRSGIKRSSDRLRHGARSALLSPRLVRSAPLIRTALAADARSLSNQRSFLMFTSTFSHMIIAFNESAETGGLHPSSRSA